MKFFTTAFAVATLALTISSAQAAEDKVYKTAIFGGGNFWYLESTFDKTPGVVKAQSGYTGGVTDNPNYQQVTTGGSGHKMAVEVTYDPKIISYDKILDVFWHSVDPTDQGGQFCDRGDQYLSVIFYADDVEKKAAQRSLISAADDMDENGIATRILPAKEFYPAEDYHQDYHVKESYKYRFNRKRCKVDEKLKDIWGRRALIEEDQ